MSRLRFSLVFLLLGSLLVAGCTPRSTRGSNGGGSWSDENPNQGEASVGDHDDHDHDHDDHDHDHDDHDHDDHDHDHSHDHETITTVTLRFEPQGGGDTVYANWADPENDGNRVIDDITLRGGEVYDLEIGFLNQLEDPAEDVTPEIRDEGDEHQIFVTGSAVRGPAADTTDALVEHEYDDQDVNGLPLGLQNTITTLSTGSGEMLITLRDLPSENGEPIKFADLAEDVADSGFSAIGGSNSVQVTFELEVQ